MHSAYVRFDAQEFLRYQMQDNGQKRRRVAKLDVLVPNQEVNHSIQCSHHIALTVCFYARAMLTGKFLRK